MTSGRWIVALIVAVIALALAADATPGCEPLTEDEFIDVTVAAVIKHDATNIYGYDRRDPPPGMRYLPYETVSEFRAANPDCCRLSPRGPDGFYPGFWKRMREDFETFVAVNFDVRMLVGDEEVMMPTAGTMAGLSSCGRLIDFD